MEENALEVASLAGHILLENGAEISRVEDTMERIASHYGVESRNFFVLSNGIFTTGRSGYAKVGNIAGGAFGTLLCVLFYKIGFGVSR